MDSDAFKEIVSEKRHHRYWPESEDDVKWHGAYRVEYRPFIECPRCSAWKLTARIHKERYRVSKGFLRGSDTEWRVVNRWWECKNCAGAFDVEPVEGSDADRPSEESHVDRTPEEPKSYRLELVGSKPRTPLDGGEKGIVRRGGDIVRVPAVSAKFRTPTDSALAEGTDVIIEIRGGDAYCVEAE